MSGRSGFDGIARFYDPLARIVFGRHMVASQTHFLHRISPGSSVLVVGGGTGWILEEVFARAANCEVWYIESSERMLDRARRRKYSGRVHFIHGSWDKVPQVTFDVVITNYFLDLFAERTLADVIRVIEGELATGGIWLVSEFTQNKRWHAAMLAAMYWFFRLLCNIEASYLPAWEKAMSHAGFLPAERTSYFGGFMESVVFRRSGEVEGKVAFG